MNERKESMGVQMSQKIVIWNETTTMSCLHYVPLASTSSFKKKLIRISDETRLWQTEYE